MKKMILVIGISAIILFGSVDVLAQKYQYNGDKNTDYKLLSSGISLMQKLRNRICDMLGICQGEVNLTNITGSLSFDSTNFYIDDVELHFGPIWYIKNNVSSIDYDGDGNLELIYDELQGLVGTELTVEGHLQSIGWMSVFTINGETYREPGQPFWTSQNHLCWQHRKDPNTA